MNKYLSFITKRAVPLLLLAAILSSSVLYQKGFFEIPFIERSDNYQNQGLESMQTPTTPLFSDGSVENTSAPIPSDSFFDELNSSGTTAESNSQTTNKEEEKLPGRFDSFLPLKNYTSKGYDISYSDYSASTVLAEITLKDYPIPENLYTENKIFIEFLSASDSTDSIPYPLRRFNTKAAMAVELYMGYIIIDDGYNLTLFSSAGKKLGEYDRMKFVPAYTRDKYNNPLFLMVSEGYNTFYRYDKNSSKFVIADYNDREDNRGLYFDYTPDYGVSDNGYKKYSAIVNCIVEMSLEKAHDYTRPETIPPTTPETTEPETTAPDTTPSDTTTSDTTTSDTTTSDTTTSDTTTSDTTTADTTTSDTTTSESVTQSANENAQLQALFALRQAARENSVQSGYSNYTISEDGKSVFVELMAKRWMFGRSNYIDSDEYKNAPDDKKLSEIYKYAGLYSFSEGLCATLDSMGRISFCDESGRAVITRNKYYYGQNNRKLFTKYAEPLLLGIDSIGSLYFDEGLVRVRQLDWDSQYTDKLSGDYTYLLRADGSRFEIPAGYKLIAYSDGVLLLERGGYYGYYSAQGKWIAQPIYTYARPFAEGLGVIGFSNSKKGIIDRNGNIVVPFKYDYISQVSSGVISLYSDGKWTIVAKVEK